MQMKHSDLLLTLFYIYLQKGLWNTLVWIKPFNKLCNHNYTTDAPSNVLTLTSQTQAVQQSLAYLSGLVIIFYLPQVSTTGLCNSFSRDQVPYHHRGRANF